MYILSEDEINELYSIPVIAEQDRHSTFLLSDKEEEQRFPKDSDLTQIYYILLLGYFKEKPVRLDPNPQQIREDFEFVRKQYFSDKNLKPVELTANQKYKIYKKIFSVVPTNQYDVSQATKLAEFAEKISSSQCLPVSLFDELLDWLRLNSIEIPSYRKLQQLVTVSFNREKARVMSVVSKNLSSQTKRKFKSFLTDSNYKNVFNNIRFEARDFSPQEIKKEISAFDELVELNRDVLPVIKSLSIPQGRIKYYAELFNDLSISRHKMRSDDEFNLLISCFIYFRHSTLIDYFGDSVRSLIASIVKDAKQASNDKVLAVKESMDELMEKAATLLEVYHDRDIEDGCTLNTLRSKANQVISEADLKNVISHMKRSKHEKELYFWEHIDKCHSVITKTLRPIMFRLEFIDAAEYGLLFQQITKLKEEIINDNEVQTLDNRLAKKSKKYLYDDNEKLISLRAEYYLYSLVASRLDDTHWFLGGSTRYRPLNESLISASKVDELAEYVNSDALKMDREVRVSSKINILNSKLDMVPKRIMSGENESLILERKDGKHKWTIKRIKGEKVVNHKTFDKVPKIDISTVIYTTARDTKFFDEIRHITGKKRVEDFTEKFIACTIANATRQGVYKMSELCDFSHDTLLRFQSNYLLLENLRKANDRISNATSKLGIFKHYNYRPGYIHASLDGQKLRSRKSTRRVRFSSKYFRKGKGLYADTLLANHVPLLAKLYSLNTHESYNVFDLLYNNSTEVVVNGVSTDTHGVNRFNFAILDLSDWEFNPRYAKANHVFETMFDVVESEEDGTWTLTLKEPIDEKVIIEGWDFIRRIIVSLHQKEICQSDLVAQLSRSSPSDKNLKALREYDRLIKAIYMLDYADDKDFRQYIQGVLNRGEAYHQLQRAFEKVGAGNSFRGKSDAEIDMWYECSRLMANCIIYFNSVVLNYVLEGYKRQGKDELIKQMAHISPVAWTHILMGGKYAFDHLKDTPDMQTMIKTMLAA